MISFAGGIMPQEITQNKVSMNGGRKTKVDTPTKMMMTLNEYLDNQWKICNHPKYYKYFKEWVENITDTQIYYFKKEMNQ